MAAWCIGVVSKRSYVCTWLSKKGEKEQIQILSIDFQQPSISEILCQILTLVHNSVNYAGFQLQSPISYACRSPAGTKRQDSSANVAYWTQA